MLVIVELIFGLFVRLVSGCFAGEDWPIVFLQMNVLACEFRPPACVGFFFFLPLVCACRFSYIVLRIMARVCLK